MQVPAIRAVPKRRVERRSMPGATRRRVPTWNPRAAKQLSAHFHSEPDIANGWGRQKDGKPTQIRAAPVVYPECSDKCRAALG